MMAPPEALKLPQAQTTVPLLVSMPGAPLTLKVTLFEMFSVAPFAMVNAPLRSPPDQLIVPLTVNGPPLRAPAEKLKLPTVAGVVTVALTLIASMAVSCGPGTWFGDQLAAVFQLPATVFVQVSVAARTGKMMVPQPS